MKFGTVISLEPDQLELTGAQGQELSRRLADHKENPDAVVSWDEIKTQAIGRLRIDE